MSELTLAPHKSYRVYFVEDGDDDRERVIVARTSDIAFKYDPQYGTIETGYGVVSNFLESERYTVELSLMPLEAGKFFRLENFNEEEDVD